ncbi:MAG: nucleoside-diphosphate kinase [Candidatus Saccharibacteria bacterium]|nr:nucleoside-diphosphate kinase [Candidatus Saccharibacteria bacterium]
MSQKHIERTFIIFKPDSVQRGIVGEILARFERIGLKIIGMKMVNPSREQYHEHYEGIGTMITRHGEHIFNTTVDFMSQGPVIIAVLEGVEAIALVRKLVGSTEPKSAEVGTIRGDYSHISYGRANAENKGIPNLIHASADASDAQKEVDYWFADNELYDYQLLHEKFTR